jgi:hypothetical protein
MVVAFTNEIFMPRPVTLPTGILKVVREADPVAPQYYLPPKTGSKDARVELILACWRR